MTEFMSIFEGTESLLWSYTLEVMLHPPDPRLKNAETPRLIRKSRCTYAQGPFQKAEDVRRLFQKHRRLYRNWDELSNKSRIIHQYTYLGKIAGIFNEYFKYGRDTRAVGVGVVKRLEHPGAFEVILRFRGKTHHSDLVGHDYSLWVTWDNLAQNSFQNIPLEKAVHWILGNTYVFLNHEEMIYGKKYRVDVEGILENKGALEELYEKVVEAVSCQKK